MKRLYIFCLLTSIFAVHLTTETMDNGYVPQCKAEGSLTKLCVKVITPKIDQLIKQAIARTSPDQDLQLGAVMEYAHSIAATNQDVQEMISLAILSQCAKKTFKKYTEGNTFIVQHYDGISTTNAERLSTPPETRLRQSPWYDLELEELVRRYSVVHYAHKKAGDHPFAPPTQNAQTPGPTGPEELFDLWV